MFRCFGAILLLLSGCNKHPVQQGLFSEKMPFSALTGIATSDSWNNFAMEKQGDQWIGVADMLRDSVLHPALPDTLVTTLHGVLKNTRMLDSLSSTRPDSLWIQGLRGIALELKFGYESLYWVIGKESFRHGKPVTYVKRLFEGAQPVMMAEGHLRKRFNLQICDYFDQTPVLFQANMVESFSINMPGSGAVTYTQKGSAWKALDDCAEPPPMPFSRSIGAFITEDPLPMRGVALKPDAEFINEALKLLPTLNLCKEIDATEPGLDFLAMITMQSSQQKNPLVLTIYQPQKNTNGCYLLHSSRYPGRYFVPTDSNAVERILADFRTVTGRYGFQIRKIQCR